MKYEKGSFLVVPNKERMKGKHPLLQAVYIRVCSFANDEGICFPSYQKIWECAWCDRRTVIRKVKELLEMGVLKKTKRRKNEKQTSNEYQIMIREKQSDSQTLVSTWHYPSVTQSLRGSVTQSPELNIILTEPIEPYEFEYFRKEYPHARTSKKKDAKTSFDKCDSTAVKKEVKMLLRKIQTWLQDPKYIPACHLRIRDFVTTNELVYNQTLYTIRKIVHTTKQFDDPVYIKLKEDFPLETIMAMYERWKKEKSNALTSSLQWKKM